VIQKIISSGQTGVELAALDAAIKLGIAHDGWTPRGRRNQDGPLDEEYVLKEASAVGFQKAMEQNVIDSDGTLLITRGQKTPETRFAVQMALKHQKQLLHVDLSQHSAFEGASLTNSWLFLHAVKVVFITGPTDHNDANIYSLSLKILETAFYLGFVKSDLGSDQGPADAHPPDQMGDDHPYTVSEAVDRLKAALPLKDRAVMANMQIEELARMRTGLGEYIKQNFGLYTGNHFLMQSCAETGNLDHPIPDEACAVILKALWNNLQATHKLRILK
jgi:hypothetical protein